MDYFVSVTIRWAPLFLMGFALVATPLIAERLRGGALDVAALKRVVICFSVFFALGVFVICATAEHCPECDAVVTSNSNYCTECGQLARDICLECGKECDTPYCGNCGAKVW